MGKHKKLSEYAKFIFALLSIVVFGLSQANDTVSKLYDGPSAEMFALYDFETGRICYKDEKLQTCFIVNFYHDDSGEGLIMPQRLPNIPPENIKNISSLVKQFCEDFPVYALSKLKEFNYLHEGNGTVIRSKRSAGQWYPGGAGASQSQVQGQVSGQGFFSGQAQSQLSGASQTQVQLAGNGILGSVSSSAGNAQAQIALGEATGSGQAGSLGLGPSKSQVQINLRENGRGSMASAGVLADEGYAHISDGRQNGRGGFGIGGSGYDRGGGYYNSRFQQGFQGGHRDDQMSPTGGFGSGSGHYLPISYGARGQGVNGGQQHSKYNEYPEYQSPVNSNGGRVRNTESNIYSPSTHPAQFPANLPQLPDIALGGFPSSSAGHLPTDLGNGHQRGINIEDLRTQRGGGLGSTSGDIDGSVSYPTQTGREAGHDVGTNQFRQPTQSSGQYPATTGVGQIGRTGGGYSGSGSGYYSGRGAGGGTDTNGYSGRGSGLPHAIASSYGTGQAQAQTQSQMVYLGRGTTEIYRQRGHGGSSGNGLSSSYPRTSSNQGNGVSSHDRTFTNGLSYPGSKVDENGRGARTNGLGGTRYQPSSSTITTADHQTYSETGNHLQSTTRATIRDGYIPTDDGYVRPYLNGVPRQQAGINGNGQYPEYRPTAPPTQRVNGVTQPPIPQSGQLANQHAQQYPVDTSAPQSNGIVPQTYSYPDTSGRSAGEGTHINGYPAIRQPYSSQQSSSGQDAISTPQHYSPTTYARTPAYPNGSNGNGGSNGKRCSVVTFTCTILIESNGRAKICRPNGSSGAGGDNGSGQIDHGRPMQICCC